MSWIHDEPWVNGETCTFCNASIKEGEETTFDYDDDAIACEDCEHEIDMCQICKKGKKGCTMTYDGHICPDCAVDNSTIRYTNAPIEYDYGFTVQLISDCGNLTSGMDQDKPVRMVKIYGPDWRAEHQCGRYGSGLYPGLTQEQYREWLDSGLIVREDPPCIRCGAPESVCECDECETCDGSGEVELTEYWDSQGNPGGRYPIKSTDECPDCDGDGYTLPGGKNSTDPKTERGGA